MSGKASRARRKDAVDRAKAAVYAAQGDIDLIVNPFDDARCSRIFDSYVAQWLNTYWRHQHEEWL